MEAKAMLLKSESTSRHPQIEELQSRVERLERDIQKLFDHNNQIVKVVNKLNYPTDESRWE
ncbi:MAG: polyhydroxyalkanoate synthesis regulator phasin [Candidatus Azotimanducaceae bacterium]|jgi:polyhydroxyalkanoate synthesis regulator phasin